MYIFNKIQINVFYILLGYYSLIFISKKQNFGNLSLILHKTLLRMLSGKSSSEQYKFI